LNDTSERRNAPLATMRQKAAARRNIKNAIAANRKRGHHKRRR
jgi:hypothetical protein